MNKKRFISFGVIICLGLLFSFWAVRGNVATGFSTTSTVTYTEYAGIISLKDDSIIISPTDCFYGSDGTYHITIDSSLVIDADEAVDKYFAISDVGDTIEEGITGLPATVMEDEIRAKLNSLPVGEGMVITLSDSKVSNGILIPDKSTTESITIYNAGEQVEFSCSVKSEVAQKKIDDSDNGIFSSETYQQYVTFSNFNATASFFNIKDHLQYTNSSSSGAVTLTDDRFVLPESQATEYWFYHTDKYGRTSSASVKVKPQKTTTPTATYTETSGIVKRGMYYYIKPDFLRNQWSEGSPYGTIATINNIESNVTITSSIDCPNNFLTFNSSDNKTYELRTGDYESSEKDKMLVSNGSVYNAKFTLKDFAGNTTTYHRVLVCDGASPDIKDVKVNNSSIKTLSGTLYYNEDLLCSFSFSDLTPCTYKVKVGSTEIAENLINATSSDGITTVTFPVTEEFKGQIAITVTDILGNSSTFESTTISLDKTPLSVTSVDINDNFEVFNIADRVIGSNICMFSIMLDAGDADTVMLTVGEQNVSLEKKNGKYVGTLTLQDGAYSGTISMTDLAGNESSVETKQFIIDATAPVLTCDAEDNTLHLAIKDKNIEQMMVAQIKCSTLEGDITSFKVNANGQTYEGSLEYLRNLFLDKTKWQLRDGTTDEYLLDITFLTEGNYEITGYAQDEGTNKSDSIEAFFTYDITKPSFTKASFSVPKGDYSDYGYISKDTIGLSIYVYDSISDIASVVVNYTTVDGKKIAGACSFKEDKENGDYYLYFFGEKACEKGLIESIKVTDASGNSSITDFKHGIIIDRETDDVELLNINIADDTNGVQVVNKDVALTLSVKDTYSGIASYEYSINGKKKSSDKPKSILYEKEIADTLVAAQNEGDDIVVSLTATDNAGNTRTVSKTYSIDTTKPQLSVVYDKTTENHYYNTTRTATVSITDDHFSAKDVTFTITNNDVNTNTKATFTSSNDKTYVATIPLSEEGTYSFGFSVTDLAGNTQVYKDNTMFTIDKTAPKLSFSYDGGNAQNGHYYSQTRVANVLVDELNFDESLVDISITTKGGTVPKLSSFTSNRTNHLAALSFAVDGDYTLSGKVTDLAGNVSEEITEADFVIDTTAPEISFSGIADNASYNGDIAPVITITDTNYDNSEVSLNGSKYGKHDEHTISVDKRDDGETIQYSSFAKVLGSDDAYTLSLTATDLAGNVTEDSISFKVNRFGSRYSLDEKTQDAVEKYYVTSEKNFVIIESNLDRVNNYELCYITNGATKVLEYEKDYSLASSGSSDGWNVYTYDIKSDMLESDGVYSFVVYSTDAAGNTSDNITKGTPLKVCLDNTTPVITVSGVEDTGVYRQKEISVKVDITDNIAYDKALVVLNGEEKEMTDGSFSLDIQESKEEQTLEVIAMDKAGNSVTTDVCTFLVDSSAGENVTVQSRKEDKKSSLGGIIIGILVILIIIVGCVILFLLIPLLRRKGADETVPIEESGEDLNE